jgi:hypothetical protein
MKIIIASILVYICLIGLDTARASEHECSEEDASAAKSSARDMTSWGMVHLYFSKYHDCTDSSIVDSATESIENLWVNHWPEIPAMIHFTSRDSAFKDFIWQRISDNSLFQEDFDTFVLHAKDECPLDALEFCRAVVKEAYKNLLIKPVIKQDALNP